MKDDASATESGGAGAAPHGLTQRVSSLIGHPFVILAVGSLITVLLVPAVTRQWQDRQRRFDIQQELAADITEQATTFTMALEFAYLAPKDESGGKKALDKEYLKWQVRSAVIEARLRAYYPGQSLDKMFQQYSAALLYVWSAHANDEPDAGYGAVVSLLRLRQPANTVRKGGDAFILVEGHLFRARDRVVNRILSAPPRV